MIIHPHSEVKDHFKFYNYTKGILDEIKNGLKADKKRFSIYRNSRNLKKRHMKIISKKILQKIYLNSMIVFYLL